MGRTKPKKRKQGFDNAKITAAWQEGFCEGLRMAIQASGYRLRIDQPELPFFVWEKSETKEMHMWGDRDAAQLFGESVAEVTGLDPEIVVRDGSPV